MAYAAITYRVQPGHEAEINEIFGGFQRADSPVLRDEQGNRPGCCSHRTVHQGRRDDPIIHYDGRLEDVARHMPRSGVHEAERRLAPYLAESRDTETPEGFITHFDAATMHCVSSSACRPRRCGRSPRLMSSILARPRYRSALCPLTD